MPLHMNTTLSGQRHQCEPGGHRGHWSSVRPYLVLLAWCLLLMLAWGLWLWRLDASDLTFDEAATYVVAHRPLLDILDYLRRAVREHPPVYYLLIHGWMALIGASEFSLRIFSVCVGLVALALTGWLSRLASPEEARSADVVALLASALLAIVPGMVYYAREARMYSLGIIWTLLSAGLFVRDWLLDSKGRSQSGLGAWASTVGLVIVHCLALFTHYYLILPILVQPLVLLVTRRWRSLLTWCAGHGFLALAGLAWLRLAPGLEMTTAGLWGNLFLFLPTLSQVFQLLGKLLFSPVVLVRLPLLYGVLALVFGGVLLAALRRWRVGVWLALALLVPPVLAYALPHPPAPRYLVFLLPLMALVLALLCRTVASLVLRHSRRRWLAWGVTLGLALATAGLLAGGGLRIALAFDRSRYGRTLETIKAYARPGDGILFYGPWQWIQFRYYDPGDLPPITVVPHRAPPRLKPEEAEPVLERLLSRYDRLWVVPASVDDVDPDHFVAGWLNTHAHAVLETRDFSLYLPPLPIDAPEERLGLTFGQVLRLERVILEPRPVPAGEGLRLSLYWRPLHRLENDVILTLALADRDGHIWDLDHTLPGKWTSPPSTWKPDDLVIDLEGLMVPQGAPPGEYAVRLMVGDESTGESLLADGEREVELATIRVVDPVRAPVTYGLPGAGAVVFDAPGGETSLKLAGYEPGGVRFQQGYAVPLTLHWVVPDSLLSPLRQPHSDGVSSEVHLRLRAVHRPRFPGLGSTSIVTGTFPLIPTRSDAAPAPDASPGRFRVMAPLVFHHFSSELDRRLISLPVALALPSDAPTGPARVTLEVLGPDGETWQAADGTSEWPLFGFTVESRPVLRRLPSQLRPFTADFGDEVGLRGYRVEGDLRPGGQLRLTYAWYARTNPTAIYAVFNHLVTADGSMVAQADGWPQGGRMLTTQWRAGEYVEDGYTLAIPPDAPPGPYVLYVGLYDAATTDRQPAFRDGQRLPNDRVPIPLSDGGEP